MLVSVRLIPQWVRVGSLSFSFVHFVFGFLEVLERAYFFEPVYTRKARDLVIVSLALSIGP